MQPRYRCLYLGRRNKKNEKINKKRLKSNVSNKFIHNREGKIKNKKNLKAQLHVRKREKNVL